MEYIKIDKIIVKDNVRKDYGDLTELTSSIKEYGIRKPLELNKIGELVDGFRRLKAAKAAGLTEVPYFVNDSKVDNTTEQILSGILSKNLNPVEEGQAFVKYMAENKLSVKIFSLKISKSEGYVQKRIEIATLPKEITDELVAGKIEIGHALLLKKMPEPEAKKYLKDIIKDKMSVSGAIENAKYGAARLGDAPFNKDQCKGCKFNGSEQSELFETGKVLSGTCMNKGCYSKKMSEYVKTLKEKYKDVLVDKCPAGYLLGSSWEAEQRGITEAYKKKCRETKENYAVTIDDSYGITIREYFKPKPKKETEKTSSVKGEVREQKLEKKIEEFKTKWLMNKCAETIKPGTKEAKVLAMLEMDGSIEVSKAFKMEEKDIDKHIAESGLKALYGMGMKDLIIATGFNGVDIKKQFIITEEFLNMHTKDQLQQLIKELGIKTDQEFNDVKKEELINFILDSNTKGKIPKILN